MSDLDQTQGDEAAKLRDELRRSDPTVCGSAPAWVVELMLENLEAAISEPHHPRWFVGYLRGANRFLGDASFEGYETLLERVDGLLSLFDKQ